MRLWRQQDPRLDEFDGDADPVDTDESRSDWLRGIARAALISAAVAAGVFAMIWWTGSAVRFATDRVNLTGSPTWIVRGSVLDAETERPISWARVEDDPSGRPPFFSTTADIAGRFELATLPERRRLRVSALGYDTHHVTVGRRWYTWLPRGSETVTVKLTRSTR